MSPLVFLPVFQYVIAQSRQNYLVLNTDEVFMPSKEYSNCPCASNTFWLDQIMS